MIVLIEYNFIKFFIFFTIIITSQINTSEIIRPRGVSISRASLYVPTSNNEFICFDGTLAIPFTAVNDDYCDCRDGSDEPGTSACSNGVFHCTNAGHKSLNIPASRVNDGICDCCDGSDEYNTNKCVNTCIELGQSARIEAQKRAELYKAGNLKRLELIQHGKQIELDKKERYEQLKRNKLEAEQVKNEKEALKHQAEELETVVLEKYRTNERELEENEAKVEFNKLDSNQNGKIEIEELQTRTKFDVDRNGEVSIEEAKHVLDGNENGLEWQEFLEKSWPKIKPLAMLEDGLFKPPIEEAKEEEEEVQQEHDEDEDEEDHNPDDDAEHVEEKTPEEEEQKPNVEYDEESQNIINKANEARDEFNSAERSVRDIEIELNELNNYLEKDFGTENEFISLYGECFEFDDEREYIYKLCPFDKALQVSKLSGSETKLGVWSSWGTNDYKYTQMFFNHGTSCWNGPQRTTRVYLECGVENKLVMVNEPNRCEYEFNFITPAVCVYDTQNESLNQNDEHDEL